MFCALAFGCYELPVFRDLPRSPQDGTRDPESAPSPSEASRKCRDTRLLELQHVSAVEDGV